MLVKSPDYRYPLPDRSPFMSNQMKQQRGTLRVQALTGAVFLAAVLCARPSPGAAQQNAQASPAQTSPAQTSPVQISPAQISPSQTTFTEQLLISGKQQWSDTGID